MNIVARAAKKSPRLFAIALLIGLVSTIVTASRWESVSAFALNFANAELSGKPSESNGGGLEKSAPVSDFIKDANFLTPGTCDTAGPVEVEGSLIGTTPTAYPTLAAAFSSINSGTHTGAITIDVCGDTAEPPAGAILNASGGTSSYTSITISPAGGLARTISGATTAGSPMIDFSGADNVTIDGLNTGGNSLTIANTTVSATTGTSTIRFIGGATGNTITNSNIQGSGTMSVATNGALIFFSTDSVTANGNDNNTISNNNIGPAGANLPTKGILCNGSTTTTAIGNSGLVINNNNIFDYFGAAVTSAGVAVNGGCNTLSVTNNRFYQTGTRTWTTGAEHNAILMNSSASTSGVQGMTITGNIVGYASNTQTGTYTLTGSTGTFRGIRFNGITGGTVSDINSNTIASVSLTGVTSSGTGTSSPFAGIMVNTGLVNTNNNTIGSQSATGSLTFSTNTASTTHFKGIYSFASNIWTTNTNNIGGISVTNTGAGSTIIFGMHGDTLSSTLWTANSNNVGGTIANSIQLSATGTSSQVIGIAGTTAPSSFTSNTVRNMTTNIGTGTTTSASMIGISVSTSTPNHTLSQNTIFNLTNTNTTAASVVTGIQFTGSTSNVVERNLIYGLTAATNSTTAEVNGIRVAGGTTVYRNNMIAIGAGIANAFGAAATNTGISGINGILEASGTNNFFHNSVYVGGSPTAGVGASFAFNGTVQTNVRSNRDNIFFNARSNSGATGSNYAVKINGSTPNPTGLTINNNVYFANGSGGVFGFFNSLDVANIAAWRTAVGQDLNSFESNPQYLDPTNATPDLHLNPSVSTVAEGNGADVGVTNDFDGQTRASLTPVDIGADAGNFMGVDLSAPGIVYTPFGNTAGTTNRTLSVTITDATGVAGGANSPRIYFNKNAGTYFSTGCTLTGGTPQNGTYDCTIDYSVVGGIVATDVIRYFVVAQDTLGNLASNPSAGFAGTDVNNVTSPPTSPNQYTISQSYSGTLTVDAGGAITSLTNTGGLFELLNNGVIVGNLTVNITSDLTAETGTVGLNQMSEEGGGAGTYTITIRPGGGAARLVSGTATGGLIRLNGADRVTFDGLNTGGDSLTIRNLSTTSTANSGATISFATDSSNNTIQNLTIEGAHTSTTSGVVFIGGGTVSSVTGNDNNLITNNVIRDRSDAAGIPTILIYSASVSATVLNSNNTISNNTLKNFTSTAIVTTQPATENWTISGNSIFEETQRTTGLIGINFTASGTNTITQNTIRDLNTSLTVTGIQLGDARNTTVSRNHIHSIPSTSGSISTLQGINSSGSSGNPASVTIVNNMVSIIPAFSNAQTIQGIRDFGFSGNTFTADHNTILIGGTASGSSSSWALVRGTAAPTNYTARNNIAFNNRTGGTGNHFAVGDQSANTGTFTSNYNIFVGTGATLANYFDYGTSSTGTAVSFAAWQTGPPARDANSLASNPGGDYTVANMFVSDTDLHLNTTGTNPALNAGTTLGTVTNDFDGNSRPLGAAVEIGADEIVPVTPGTIQFSSATYSAGEAAGNVALTVTRTGGSDGAVSVDYGTGGGTATAGACAPGVDYNTANGTLNFASGETSKTFNVTICNDAVYELNQTFNATLSNPTGGASLGTPNPATVTINNDDDAPTVTINDVSLAEGNSGTTNFQTTFTITGANEVTGGFNFQTSNNTATAPSDYTAIAPTSAIIPANVNRTTATLNGSIVLVNGDTMFESNETFFLNGSSCTDCSFADPQGLATIQNDDIQPSLQFSSATYTVGEGGGSATITVTRTGAVDNAVAVNYATVAGGTATGGATCGGAVDYQDASGTLNFAAGVVSQTFGVTICDDALIESGETVNLALSSATGGAVLGTPNTTVLTITDNDSDTTAPVITYTPIPNNSFNPTLVVTAADNVGVTGVTIFYSFNGGAFTNAACSFSTGSPTNGTWNCTISGMPIPAAVAYYVTATDGTNTSANPTAGATAPNLFTFANATIPAGTYNNVSLSGSTTLGGNVVVNGSLTLNGVVNTGANTLTLGCGVAITGGGEISYVVGNLERLFCTTETFTFHTGAPFAFMPVSPEGTELSPEGEISNYSPVTVTILGGISGSSLTVSVTDGFMGGAVQVNSISRYWTVTETGILIADMAFTYRNEDVVGTETSYNVLRRAGGVTANYPGGTVNAAANTATAPNVSDFSQWSAGTAVPTAANAEIGGRLLTARGEGIRNATVMLQGGGLTQPVFVRTGTFGYYRFSDLPVGQTYLITVLSNRFTFANPTRVINLSDTVTDENFVAEPQ